MFSISTCSYITLIALCCGDDQFSCAFYLRLAMFPWELLVIPREAKGYSFGLVRLSVRPSRSFFLFCALIDSETTQPTTMKPIPYESWGSGLCNGGRGPIFPAPPKFRRDRPLKTAENHIFHFLELHNSKSFMPYESPASVV